MDIINDLNNGVGIMTYARSRNISFKTIPEERDRILFHKNRKTKSGNHINGIIVEKINGTWKCVCMPLPAQSSRTKIPRHINYDIYELFDGTVLNVYFSELFQKWMISTRRSLDIKRESFRGHKYAELLADFNDEFFDKLEIGKTYTYVFSCPEIHYKDKFIVLVGISTPSSVQYCTPKLDLSLDEALKRKNVILRSPKISFVIFSEEAKRRNTILFEPMLNDNKESYNFLKKKNMEKNFIEAKCYAYKYELEIFGNYAEEVKIKLEFLDKIRNELIMYILAKIRGIKYIQKMSPEELTIDMVCEFENFFNLMFHLMPKKGGKNVISTAVDKMFPVILYQNILNLKQ